MDMFRPRRGCLKGDGGSQLVMVVPLKIAGELEKMVENLNLKFSDDNYRYYPYLRKPPHII